MRGIDRTQGRTQSDASDATLVSTSFLIDTSPSKPSIESSSTKENTPLSKIFWLLLDIILLGFRQKFENRLQTYSASDYEEGKIGEWRTGQQEEWDRLGMTTTLMATISAASLAFSGIDNSWWVARGAFAGALGLSMCGYLVIHHFGVLSEGVDDNKILYAAGGYLSPGGSMTVVAITMSIPVLLSVYSAALVLFGHIVFIFTVQLGTSSTPETFSKSGFCIFAGVPVLFGLVMLAFSVFTGEFMYRQAHKDRHIV